MSEQAPQVNHETESPKVTVDGFEQQMLEAGEPISAAQANVEAAQEKVDNLNFASDATDHVYAKSELRDANAALRDTEATQQAKIDALQDEWQAHGGARVDAARAAVEALNFKSSAEDHVRAKAELRDAKAAWEESYNASKAAPTEEVVEPAAVEQPVEATPEAEAEAASEAEPEAKKPWELRDETEVEPEPESESTTPVEEAQPVQPEVVPVAVNAPETTEMPVAANEAAPQEAPRKFTFKDVVKRPGAYLAVKLAQYRMWKEGYDLRNQRPGDDFEKREKNRKLGTRLAIGAAAVAAGLLAIKTGFDIAGHMGDGAQQAHTALREAGPLQDIHPSSAPREIIPQVVPGHQEFVDSAANTIPAGGGGEAFMKSHGVDASVWYNNELDFHNKYPNLTYQMPDGHFGFSHKGPLPKEAVDYWAAKAGR